MNKFSKKLILPSLATLLLFNAHIFGDDAQTENTDSNSEAHIENHVSVRSRESDPEKREQMRLRRIKEQEDIENAQTQQPLRKTSNNTTSLFKLAPRELIQPQYCLAALPVNCHWLVGVADNFRSIQIEDGSRWEISVSDAYKLRNWEKNHKIVITPNYSWFSSYDYYVTNQNTNTAVLANLYSLDPFGGSLYHGSESLWIISIDYFGGHIGLVNQTLWCVDPQDSYVIKDWAVDDHIIIGSYSSWFSPYDHILINVNMDDHVRVKQY